MPRAAGQIDLAKNEAILEAAASVLAERGLAAPMSAIARRAGVSKQTIYNHYGAKTDLIRALANRRVTLLTAPLAEPGAQDNPEEALTRVARILIDMVAAPQTYALMRLIVQSSTEMPELAREFYEVGPRAVHKKLAVFLEAEAAAGRLAITDPLAAGELFSSMAIGHKQVRALLGLPLELDDAGRDKLAREVAHRFVRAFGV